MTDGLAPDLNVFSQTETPEFKKWLAEYGKRPFGRGSFEYTINNASQIKRTLQNSDSTFKTLGEANEFFKSLGFNGSAFFEDPLYATMIRMERATRSIENADYLFNAINLFGKFEPNAVGATSKIFEAIGKRNQYWKQFSDVKFQPEIARHLDKMHDVIFGGEAGEFIKKFDELQNIWKRWTLGVFPAYHFRNVVGNEWNNYLAGVGLKSRTEGYNIVLKRAWGHKELTKAESSIYKEASARGVINHGMYASDIPKLGRSKMERLTQSAIPEKGMEWVGVPLENSARLLSISVAPTAITLG